MLLLSALVALPAVRIHAQQSGPATEPASQQAAMPNEEHMDAPDTNADIQQYRHSATVKAIARLLHVKTETAAEIFEDLNSGVLILILVVVLAKVLPGMFRRRSENLQKELTEAQRATEDANRRLSEVEARLSRLGGEIETFRLQSEQESIEDEKRIRAALEAERERIIASLEQEIGAIQATAQRELKKFAADLAIDQAMHKIQLSADVDRALVRELGKELTGGSGGTA